MSSAHSGIQALLEIARRDGMEMRPVLLRVLTDLYVQEPVHVPSERARFAELACRLLDRAEPTTRAAVAERLAGYSETPPQVAEKLSRDEIAVAAPILKRSSVLNEAALHMVLNFCGPAHAAAIAERHNLPPRVLKRLKEMSIPRSELVHLDEAKLENARGTTFALARRYLAAKNHERLTIFSAIAACAPVEQEEMLRRLDRGLVDKLERAALKRRLGEFVAHLHEATGMARDVATRILRDPSGEPLAVICRALDVPFTTASRILLFLNPSSGGTVQQVFGMASRYMEMTPANARRLAAAWCGLGEGLQPERSMWTRTRRERIDPRPAGVRSIRYVTPARPAAASEM
jgi:uncharacterized protein (DUF2336 family)